MKRSHRFSRISATVVYIEYIADRHHVHMNSIQWATLTEFIKYLGREGKCKVEETPKGWFITYIDRDLETHLKERMKRKRERSELAEEERQERAIQAQIERAVAEMSEKSEKMDLAEKIKREIEPNPGDGEKPVEKIKITLAKSNLGDKTGANGSGLAFGEVDEPLERSEKKGKVGVGGSLALDELMREEEKAKERSNRKDYWLYEGIVVKVMSKTLKEKGYYKQKGVVVKVIDKYVGEN